MSHAYISQMHDVHYWHCSMAEHSSYLERSGVARELQQVLNELVSKQPEEPLAHLAKHFEHLVKPQREPVVVAVELLQGADITAPSSLEATVYKAFAHLSECDGELRALSAGVASSQYNRMLKELCSISLVGDSLLKQLQVTDEKNVFYQHFRDGVVTCLTLQEYLKISEELFQLLDKEHKGYIMRQAGEGILAQLSAAFSCATADSSQRLQRAKRLLQPTELTRLLKNNASKESSRESAADKHMSLKDFERLAAELFISHLTNKQVT